MNPNPNPDNPTLESSVQNAVDQVVPPVSETPPVETPAVETPPVETPAEGPDPEQVKQALSLYQLLLNPETQQSALEFVAKQAGFQLSKPQEPPAPQQRSLDEILKESLGEYGFLAPGLAKALGTYLSPIQEQLSRTQFENSIDRAITKLNLKTGGDFDKRQPEISKLMDTFQPAKGVNYETYLEQLYNFASGTKAAPAIAKDAAMGVVNRINANAKANLPSPSAATEPRVIKGPKLPSLNESIAAALRGETFE